MLRRSAALLIVVALIGPACGGGGGDDEVVLEKVPEELVPAEIASGELRFYPNDDDGTKRAFADAGDDTLQADARLWELRQGERLVGALQVTTVVPDVDLRTEDDRNTLLRLIIVGSANRLDIGDTPVWVTANEDKVVYVWFARSLFEVLQLKGSRLDAEAVITELVNFQTATPAWDPIAAEDYDPAEAN